MMNMRRCGWKEAFVTSFEVPSWQVPGGPGKNRKKSVGRDVAQLKFELSSSVI
jgi:hypothetical protein